MINKKEHTGTQERAFKPIYSLCILIIFLLSAAIIPLKTAYGNQPSGFIRPDKLTVIIDPGHGGSDYGTKYANGSAEKNFSLKVARKLSEALKNRYNIIFTRTGDYNLDNHSRASIANGAKADLFLSLHTGGSFSSEASGITICYWSTPPRPSDDNPDRQDTPATWDENQEIHRRLSRSLAILLRHNLAKSIPGFPVNTLSAPYSLLGGTDMPALIIETGYLTNPDDNNRLNDDEFISQISNSIRESVDTFFRNVSAEP